MRQDKWPVGLFFKEDKPAYHQQVSELQQDVLIAHDKSQVDLSKILKEFK